MTDHKPRGRTTADRARKFAMTENDARPCGGTKCSGTNWCDECLLEIEKFERERWAEYYNAISPVYPEY